MRNLNFRISREKKMPFKLYELLEQFLSGAF